MKTLYVAISAHGFGHATRTIAVINELRRRDPDILPIFVTTLPQWLFEHSVEGRFLYRPRALDVGVIQSDSFTMDLDATLEALRTLQERAPQIIRHEADFIRTNRVSLVFGDMPPLSCAIAQAAGVPCWMAGNFGWDFIYRPYGEAFAESIDWIAALYAQCDRLFRLPMHAEMTGFPQVESIGFTGAEPHWSRDEILQQLSLSAEKPTVLLTFGGLGIDHLPYERLADFPDWQFITFDRHAADYPHLLTLDGQHWRPVDIMPICSQILAKPGYSTLSEAIKVGVPIRCMTREGFIEAPLLLEGLRNYAPHQIIPQEHIFHQPWDFLREPLTPAQDPLPPDRQGNQTLAAALHHFFSTLSSDQSFN